MDEHANPRFRRLCISVDVEAPRHRGALDGILDGVCRGAEMDRALWMARPDSGGALAVLPPGIDEGALISGFITALDALAEMPRLRVAMHFGMAEVAETGYCGAAPARAMRMCGAPQLADVMVRHPGARYALALSPQVYEDHAGDDRVSFPVAHFTMIALTLAGQDGSAEAWVYLPPTGSRLALIDGEPPYGS